MVCRHSFIVKRRRQQCFFRVSQQTFYSFFGTLFGRRWYTIIIMITVPSHTQAFTRNCYGRRVVDILMSIHFCAAAQILIYIKDNYCTVIMVDVRMLFLCATPTITTTLWFYSVSLIVMFGFRDIRLHVI